MFSIIVTAAGNGTRSGLSKNKVLFDLNGQTVIEKSVRAFLQLKDLTEIIVTASADDVAEFSEILRPIDDRIKIVLGGATRTLSIANALAHVTGEYVLIHDGARPFVSKELIDRVANCVIENDSAIPVLPSTDTLGFGNGKIESVRRENCYRIQTPQAFKTELIKRAYARITPDDDFTDDSGVYSKYVAPCFIVDGETGNEKLTYPEDFSLTRGKDKAIRIGTGFDLHRLVEGRKLILGGVTVPHDKGLLGHSDADVLTHAVMDALLSSVCERDIGYHFPDTDERYKGADSMKLLAEVMKIVARHGFKPKNVSAVIMAEKPKLMKFVPTITANLAAALDIPEQDLGITCTTLEGLGIIGEEKAIAVRCYLLVEQID